jgi:hypothetical protein
MVGCFGKDRLAVDRDGGVVRDDGPMGFAEIVMRASALFQVPDGISQQLWVLACAREERRERDLAMM